jgi:hypothetical protein
LTTTRPELIPRSLGGGGDGGERDKERVDFRIVAGRVLG